MILFLKTENIMNGSYGSNIEGSRNYSNYGKTVPLKILSANQENWITRDIFLFLASRFLNFRQMNDMNQLMFIDVTYVHTRCCD